MMHACKVKPLRPREMSVASPLIKEKDFCVRRYSLHRMVSWFVVFENRLG